MIEIALQYKDDYYFPYTDGCKEASKEFKNNQIVRAKLYGVKKERSYKQLNTYWACCGLVAELLSDHTNILSRQDVDFETKIRVGKENPTMIKRFKMVSGVLYMEPISVAIPNLPHLEACKFFDKAFPAMGKMVNMTEKELIRETQARMK